MLNFILNGKQVAFVPQPGEMLADLLRQRLGLTGTKSAATRRNAAPVRCW